jgi:hypothetical protein
MAGYSPLRVTGMSTGLVQEREEFILPDDAYPILQNAYVWRERILRKRGYQLLGRLQRTFTAIGTGLSGGASFSFNLLRVSGYVAFVTTGLNPQVTTNSPHGLQAGDSLVFTGVGGLTGINGLGLFVLAVVDSLNFTIGTTTVGAYTSGGFWFSSRSLSATEPNASIVPGSVVLTMGGIIFTDQGNGTLTSTTMSNVAAINYSTGLVAVLTTAGALSLIAANFSYYPGLPVMGIRIEELQNSANDRTLFFDQKYCYVFNAGTNAFQEFIPGTAWNASNQPVSGVDFFFSTNYWVSGTAFSPFDTPNSKLFWVTNNTGYAGPAADSPRITDGVSWVDFAPPTYGQIDATNFLTNWLCMLPFRGRMVTFNTWEGTDKTNSLQYSNRIRWSTIGNPFIPFAAGPPSTGSWRDDIRGQGGFLDIPTSEDIVAIGFVRDNLVIYCERSTWQLRYSGRSIAPFQIERVNSELGAEGTFSAVQFDTSLVGIGDKGVVECDSYKSERIDIKIPDLVFQFQSTNNGVARVHGFRDFVNRLAYWTFPLATGYDSLNASPFFPNQRLVYNYENDSWALFNDSLTTIGTYQVQSNRTWLNTTATWIQSDFAWTDQPQGDPVIVAGNQQGFIEQLDELTVNDVSLYISAITGNTLTPTQITSPNHNMRTNFVIMIQGIPGGTAFANLNGGIFGITVTDANNFLLRTYNSSTQDFTTPQKDPPGIYVGGGYIKIRENFSIQSKKFNFLDEGQAIQIGYIDVLLQGTEPSSPGAISLNMYLDYNDELSSNTIPKNIINDGTGIKTPDTFFNSVIPTTASTLNNIGGTKFWQRVYCATRANFLTLQYTFSNAQMAGEEQEKGVQIDAQVIWLRRGGRMTQ